jgi:ParB family chromosome partitioning protein
MPEVHLLPLAEIDEDSLIRDRTALDADALTELRLSIAVSGLRMPIEVYELAEPRGPHRYGLISGFRRLAAVRALAETFRDKSRLRRDRAPVQPARAPRPLQAPAPGAPPAVTR